MVRVQFLTCAAIALALGSCRKEEREAQGPDPDPAIVAALSAPLMTDPDLASQNRGNAAIVLDQFDGVPALPREPGEAAR